MADCPIDISDPRFIHINQELVDIRGSQTQGWGWFAKQDIKEGTWLWKNTFNARETQTLKYEDLAALNEHERHQVFQFSETEYELVPRDDPNYYQNHSCDPNTWFQGDDLLTARRDIKKDEELTCDYATFDSVYPYTEILEKCRCGTSLCRGVVTIHDWKREDVRTRYDGHFLEYLQKKVDTLKIQ